MSWRARSVGPDRWRWLSFVVAGVMATWSAASGQVANRLLNPGFETGPNPLGSFIAIPPGSTALANWTVAGAAINYRADLAARDGQRLVELAGTSPTLRQSVTTRPGALYVVDGSLASRATPGGLNMLISNAEPGANAFRAVYVDTPWAPPAGPLWQPFSQAWTAAGSTSSIELNASAANATLQIDAMSLREVAPPFTMNWALVDSAPACANNLALIGSGRAQAQAMGIYLIGDGSGSADVCRSRVGIVRMSRSGATQVTSVPLPAIDNDLNAAGCVAPDGAVWIASVSRVDTTYPRNEYTIRVYSIAPPYSQAVLETSLSVAADWDQMREGLAMCYVPQRGPLLVYAYDDYHAPIGPAGPFLLATRIVTAYRVGGVWSHGTLVSSDASASVNTPIAVTASDGHEVTVAWAGGLTSAPPTGLLSSWNLNAQGALNQVRSRVTGSGAINSTLAGAYIPGTQQAVFICSNAAGTTSFIQPWRMAEPTLTFVQAETNWTDSASAVRVPAVDITGDRTTWMSWIETNSLPAGSATTLRVLRGRDAGPCCYDRYQRLRFSYLYLPISGSDSTGLRMVGFDEGRSAVFWSAGNQIHAGLIQPVDRGWPCPGDFDGSGAVGVGDLFEFLTAWFAAASDADVDRSGQVALEDLFEFLGSYFGRCP